MQVQMQDQGLCQKRLTDLVTTVQNRYNLKPSEINWRGFYWFIGFRSSSRNSSTEISSYGIKHVYVSLHSQGLSLKPKL